MKRTLSIMALTLATASAQAAVGDTVNLTQGYVADGVSATFYNGTMTFGKAELQNSTRFYDSQKGWVAGTSYGDSYMCWAHTASNMIQYWQSYYGVFCKSSESLPYGTDCKRTLYNVMNPGNSPVIADPLRLNVMKALYNSGFSNVGNEVSSGTNWFFTWVNGEGGFYSDYFGAVHAGETNSLGQTATTTAVNSLSTLKTALLPALGLSESGGVCTQTEAGLIAHLNVTDGSNPHTLTCYGLTTHADGSIKSVLVADSDDFLLPSYEGETGNTGPDGTYMPKLTQLYVQVDENGRLLLYSDSNYSTEFTDGQDYYISGITKINTPEVLRNMLAEYSDFENEAQVWNGQNSVWQNTKATTEELPTADTGWDVHVNGENIAEEHHGYYHSYATEGRRIRLDEHAAEDRRNITIVGSVSAAHIEVAAAGYKFTAGENAELKAGANLSLLHMGELSSEVELKLADLTLESGSSLEASDTISVSGMFRTLDPAALQATRSIVTPAVSIGADLDLTAATGLEMAGSVNMNGHRLLLSSDTPITLNISPGENIFQLFSEIGSLSIDGTEILDGADLSSVFRLSNSEQFNSYSITYADNELSLVVPEPGTITLAMLALAAQAGRRRRK